MKKRSLICFFTVFCACQSHVQNDSLGASSVSDANDSVRNKSQATIKHESSTYDSLQGIWEGNDDTKEKRIFRDSIQYLIYEDDTVKSNFLLASSCAEQLIEPGKKSGSYLIVHDEDTLCYQIDNLTSSTLILFYNGRTLKYNRVK